QRQEPPESPGGGDHERGDAEVGTGHGDNPLPATRTEQIEPEAPEARRDGILIALPHAAPIAGALPATGRVARRRPTRSARRRAPSATMRLPRTQATVPRPGQVVS